MSQPELLKLVGQRLASAGIDCMVSGAIAATLGVGETITRLRAEARPVE